MGRFVIKSILTFNLISLALFLPVTSHDLAVRLELQARLLVHLRNSWVIYTLELSVRKIR